MHSCVQSFKKKKKSYYISTVFESRTLGHKISCTDVLSEASCAVEKLHLGISFIRSSLHSLSFSPSSLSPSPSHTHLEHAFLFFFFFFFHALGKQGAFFKQIIWVHSTSYICHTFHQEKPRWLRRNDVQLELASAASPFIPELMARTHQTGLSTDLGSPPVSL